MPQEIEFTDRRSVCRFDPFEKQLVATPGALETFGAAVVNRCMDQLRGLAMKHGGIDYLQIFHIGTPPRKLWIIEDGDVITALLPQEY